MAFSRSAALGYLKRAHERNRLAHAYLISGAPGSGKHGLVTDLTNWLHEMKSEDIFASNRSGVIVAKPEGKLRRIAIEQVRDLEHSLQLRAVNGRRKIAIISQADRLQREASHAFLKTLEEPPRDSLLLLLSALPEALPETIRSRCIEIPLIADQSLEMTEEETELVDLLRAAAREKNRGVHAAYRILQGFQGLLDRIKEQIQSENNAALKNDQARYKNTTEGLWLEEREEYFKALTESLYSQRRARLIETLFLWWSDVLRASTQIARRDLPSAKSETECLARQLTTPQILGRLRRLEILREHLDRNVQQTLALECAFLNLES
jgi:DNA polymerase III subunit delta'